MGSGGSWIATVTSGTLVSALSLASLAACGSSGGSGGVHDGGGSAGDDVSTGGGSSSGAGSSGGGSSGDGSSSSGGALVDASATQDGSDSGYTSVCPLTDTDAGTCNGLVPNGPVVPAICVTGTPVQPAGGTIYDGVYALDSFSYYGVTPCPTSTPVQTTWAICGDSWGVVQVAQSASPVLGNLPPVRHDFFTTNTGQSITFAETCVGTGNGSITVTPRGYTATDHDITFIYPAPGGAGGTVVSHYLRQ